jgi:hypothetical protein
MIHEVRLMVESNVETQRKLLGLVTFIGTLSLTFWWSGASIYPIETLAGAVVLGTIVLVALLLRVMAGTSLAFTVRSISVPVGLYVSLLSLVQASDAGSGFIGIFLSLITSGLLFLSCMHARKGENTCKRNRAACLLAIAFTLLLPVIGFIVFAQFPLVQLYHPPIFLLVFGSFIALYLLLPSNNSRSERLIFASAYNVVLQAVIAVMMFIIVTQWMDDGSFVLRVSAISVSILVPLAVYLATLIYAISENKVGDVGKLDIQNWHIVEGYLFFMAMVVAPPSIIEYILSQQT